MSELKPTSPDGGQPLPRSSQKRKQRSLRPWEFRLVPIENVLKLRDALTVQEEGREESVLFDTPDSVVNYWPRVAVSPCYNPAAENLVVFLLNARRRLIGHIIVTVGTLDTLIVHPREVFRPAIVCACAAIIIAHNHPSGDPSPSESDIKVTRDLIRAGQLLRIDLLDHVIVGSSSPAMKYISLRSLGYFYS